MTRKPLTKDFNPGNARWCEQHTRLECVKNRRKGRGHCHSLAISGTDSCMHHGGITLQKAKVQGMAEITAWSALGDTNQAVDHKIAVIGVMQMTWLRLGAYSELLRRQVEGSQPKGVVEWEADENGVISYNGSSKAVDNGLIGYRYGAAGRDGNIYAQSEEVRALVELEARERDRVVKYAETAHKMGISDRLTSLAEQWGDVVASRVTQLLDALELTPDQAQRVPALIQQHLGSIEIGSGGGGRS